MGLLLFACSWSLYYGDFIDLDQEKIFGFNSRLNYTA